jgi:hypothetical protein
MFQCPVCDFTSTYSKNNVKSHMVSLHGLAVSAERGLRVWKEEL